MAVSTDFAPPFKLIAPYFIIGAVVFVLSTFLLFTFDTTTIQSVEPNLLAWVHLFLLGFVMMVIFGAMAQLVPVVLEVGHFAVDLYYIIYPLLLIGTILMAIGFVFVPILLPFGGLTVLIALSVFLFETFLTIKKVEKYNFVIISVLIANIFLAVGMIFGIIMALGYAGVIVVDIPALLHAHIFLVFVGYVGVTIMGMSLILLPMFWLSHGFSWDYVKSALLTLSLGVTSITLSPILDIAILDTIGYILSIIASTLYFYQVYIIYKKRVRIENDIYFISLIFSYISLLAALILAMLYLLIPSENLIISIGWLLIGGYVSFLIIGHLYKIVPFLVWYERFSPLVGKEKVPMLADMIPQKSANLQFWLNALGIIISTAGILFASNEIFYSGVSFLSVGSLFVLKDIIYMIRFKS
ncbi:hypothetical protein FJR48_01650 [Sulfurimonas lithotrophica]|uniref:Cytochrome C oxidase subunit I n=1 Tax=Sulfurimonas lithotrophica TaxID=2590022 RepID=A0A5P8NYJ4_9BACT|nr:hypothetical protein [Sulfurimonas lithotrophica]QFR48498.1 hypothetical protein FJR48_01650 [Sulfurimonas lithotrophica]